MKHLALLLIISASWLACCLSTDVGVCANDVCTNEELAEQAKIAKGANAEGRPPEVSMNECNDRHEQCKGFQRQGECENNPGWMIINCPVSCKACHLRDPKLRCDRNFLNISAEPIYKPGDLNKMFSNIQDKYDALYNVTIHSTSPWVVTFENFLTEEEVDALISTVDGQFERSTDTGQPNEFGEVGRTLSTGRTSSNAWCQRGCYDHPLVQQVVRKIEQVTEVPSSHYENFQVLHYQRGQRYNTHHDMAPRQNILSSGPRILTFFLYLSDVEEGGETRFPRLDIAVKPKKGKALLWPSTKDENMERQDPRTHHEALAVIKGNKFAANAWIHLYDFQKSNLWGCTGTFDYL